MARDRFAELGQRTQGRSHNNNNSHNGRPQYEMSQPRYENNNTYPTQHSSSMRGGGSFQDMTDEIKRAIETIRKNTRELQNLHRRALVEIQNNQAQALSQQLDSLIDSTSNLIQKTRGQLKNLSNAPGGDPQVKQVQQKALARKLMEVAREYQGVQQSAKSQYKGQLERQYRIAKPNATREEVSAAIDGSSNGGSNVFQQEILSSRVGDQRKMLQQVQNRQHDLAKIEQSLMELFNLMQDMQMLLEQQQTMINTIETNIDDAATNVELGSTELTKATDNARSARKKKWCILVLCLILLAVAAVLVYFYVVSPLITASNVANSGNGDNNSN